MNYELAKQLREAGFPNIRVGEYFDHRIGSHSDDYGGSSDAPCHCNEDKYPTLSELIEACGDCLSHIKKYNGQWWAVSHCGHVGHEPGGNNLEEADPVIDVAVAKLWLALNTKSNEKETN
jgi:hypothetical protein